MGGGERDRRGEWTHVGGREGRIWGEWRGELSVYMCEGSSCVTVMSGLVRVKCPCPHRHTHSH